MPPTCASHLIIMASVGDKWTEPMPSHMGWFEWETERASCGRGSWTPDSVWAADTRKEMTVPDIILTSSSLS